MPKGLSCWFWKPKNKLFSSKGTKSHKHNVGKESTTNYFSSIKVVEKQRKNTTLKRRAFSLSDGEVGVDRKYNFGLPPNKFQSYPVSPRKTLSLENDKGHITNQNIYIMSRKKLYKKGSSLVYRASPYKNFSFTPKTTIQLNKHYPFEMQIRGEDTFLSSEDSKNTVKKSMEDFTAPNICQENSSFKYQKNLGSEYENSEGNKTIVRIKRLSNASSRPPRASLKITPFGTKRTSSSSQKYVRQFPLKPDKQKAPILVTDDGKILYPVKTGKLQKNSLQQRRETPTLRASLVQPIQRSYEEPVSFRRNSIRKSSIGRSSVNRDEQTEKFRRSSLTPERDVSPVLRSGDENIIVIPITPKNSSSEYLDEKSTVNTRANKRIAHSSVISDNIKLEHQPFGQAINEPVVYAATVPTRGSRKSVLLQSLKSLVSKNQKEEPTVYRKNIRYSTDIDVFAAEARRRSNSYRSPRFVNMEKGQSMLVSEFLNPITSLFISDFKDPIPKDPLAKPKESNVWVTPKGYRSRISLTKKPKKPVVRIQQVYRDSAGTVPTRKKINRESYSREESSSSSSEESVVVYRNKSKQFPRRRSNYHAVYAAQMPSPELPYPQADGTELFADTPKRMSYKDNCGLSLGSSSLTILKQKNNQVSKPSHCCVKLGSSTEKVDTDTNFNLVFRPSGNALKDFPKTSESGSKLRWRIIIKRGKEN